MKLFAKLVTDLGIVAVVWTIASGVFTHDWNVVILYIGILWPLYLFLIFGPILHILEKVKRRRRRKHH